jgi:hypothetical protein
MARSTAPPSIMRYRPSGSVFSLFSAASDSSDRVGELSSRGTLKGTSAVFGAAAPERLKLLEVKACVIIARRSEVGVPVAAAWIEARSCSRFQL